jgi:hypothetical protein
MDFDWVWGDPVYQHYRMEFEVEKPRHALGSVNLTGRDKDMSVPLHVARSGAPFAHLM